MKTLQEVRCEGCGSDLTDFQVKYKRNSEDKFLSCCPERKALNIEEWKAKADTLEAEVARLNKEVATWRVGAFAQAAVNQATPLPAQKEDPSDLVRAFNAWTPTAQKEDVIVAIARALERAEKSPSGYIPAMIANDLQAAGLLSDRERGLEEAGNLELIPLKFGGYRGPEGGGGNNGF